ncbi:DNA replication initiation control protein YabA [Periweissella beninensis]|uniref:DNA replication initiation control protein YabA n=1 Tax=Periweissella beninensis TaxID=504936 RepID=A0ABT0VGF6_9LACO|nr:DNA replication initiation control protein YabA [Periweissella beninensis]MBM7544640.1 regulator of replication initiation timing [Periweissella beninensis]MCM2436917.1 DNA replication initiation control protein YabA [Periweissella beninensis]MCT4396594.1 DNA replication initiation control protein YabA [Periweissella beninensis]
MEKKEVYDRFSEILADMQHIIDETTLMQATLNTLIEENAELTIENEHLRSQIMNKKTAKIQPRLSRSRENLRKLYESGFHICNASYGRRLEDGESCLECLDIIYGS